MSYKFLIKFFSVPKSRNKRRSRRSPCNSGLTNTAIQQQRDRVKACQVRLMSGQDQLTALWFYWWFNCLLRKRKYTEVQLIFQVLLIASGLFLTNPHFSFPVLTCMLFFHCFVAFTHTLQFPPPLTHTLHFSVITAYTGKIVGQVTHSEPWGYTVHPCKFNRPILCIEE